MTRLLPEPPKDRRMSRAFISDPQWEGWEDIGGEQ